MSGSHVIAGCSEYSDPINRRDLQFKRDAAPVYTSDGAYRLYDCSENFDIMGVMRLRGGTRWLQGCRRFTDETRLAGCEPKITLVTISKSSWPSFVLP